MSELRHIEIKADDDGQRLDRWLKKCVPEMPYVLAQKLIRKGQIRVDGKRAKMDTRLSEGQIVKIPPVKGEARSQKNKPRLSEEDAEFMRSLVIYDDGDVIAINKPYGLAVQGGSKVKRHVDGMLDALIRKDKVRPRLVHRLDKDTSGVLLLARSAKAVKGLGEAFKRREVKKIYWALVTPTPSESSATIKAPVLKDGGPNKEKMVVDEDGKFAMTEYEVIEHAADRVAFVAFWPRTGRTHQIRVHAQIMECPILGDYKYGFTSDMVEGLEFADRLHLHAHQLILKHPTENKMLNLKAPLEGSLKQSWKAFGFDPNYKQDPFADL